MYKNNVTFSFFYLSLFYSRIPRLHDLLAIILLLLY
jgi:hypothetical protein